MTRIFSGVAVIAVYTSFIQYFLHLNAWSMLIIGVLHPTMNVKFSNSNDNLVFLRLLMFSVASLIAGDCDNKAAVQALWFSTMKILLNLTHDNGNFIYVWIYILHLLGFSLALGCSNVSDKEKCSLFGQIAHCLTWWYFLNIILALTFCQKTGRLLKSKRE